MAGAPSGITDPLVAARYAEAVDINPATLATHAASGWMAIKCDRPMIFWPVRSIVSNTALANVTLKTAGLTYAAGNVLTLTGGTGTSATVTVDAVDGTGAITSFTLTTAGSYTVPPGIGTLSATGGAGSGATFSFNTYGPATGGTTYNTGSARVIYYAPNRIPYTLDAAQRSKGAGIVYMPNPGTWYLQAAQDSTGEYVQVQYLLIDAQDPAIAARYLSESGTHRIRTNATVATATGTTAQLIGENRNRTGLLITVISSASGTTPLQKHRLAFGVAAVNSVGVEIGTSTTATFAMFGEGTWKGSVDAIVSDGQASPAAGRVTVTEWE